MVKVLLIEPERPLMRVMGWVLEEAGFAVIAETDVKQALEVVPQIQPDVVVLNGEIEDPERARIIDALRTEIPHAAVIDIEKAQAWNPASAAKADAVVIKPFHAETLVEIINRLSAEHGGTALA